MANRPILRVENPAIPLAPTQYSRFWQDQLINVLRLFFNRLVTNVRIITDRVESPELFEMVPTTEPSSPEAGWVYYDSGTNKLRCYDGTIWNDLF